MKSEKIIHNNKILGYVYIPEFKSRTRKEILNEIVAQINPTIVGHGGLYSKKVLKEELNRWMFPDKGKLQKILFNRKKIIDIITRNLILASNYVKSPKPTRIFVYPYFKKPEKEFRGVYGFSPYKYCFSLYINPVKDWEKGLANTIVHEYTHSISHHYHNWEKLSDSLVFEGLAEHFREEVIGGKIAPWSNAVSKNKCKEYFKLLKNKLNRTDLHQSVFFGSKDYPRWLGYSIGYNFVGEFITNNKISWSDLLKIKPDKIISNSKP